MVLNLKENDLNEWMMFFYKIEKKNFFIKFTMFVYLQNQLFFGWNGLKSARRGARVSVDYFDYIFLTYLISTCFI